MAIKKTQMYRRNLDGTETRLNPLTESQYVLMENGQTVQEVLSDRDSDKYTPVITNSSSTFKVGQGDNVDLSSSMKEGAYDSCVLKGKTMVNCIQEPSSKDVVLSYQFTDGQHVTINDTKESGALGVELKGQTLVNIHKSATYSLSCQNSGWYDNYVTKVNEVSFTITNTSETGWRYLNLGKLNLNLLKPNTKYLVVFSETKNLSTVQFMNGDGTRKISNTATVTNNRAILTTNSTLDLHNQVLYTYFPMQLGEVVAKNAMIIEYQDGMENWELPYIEGMQSVKMPTLHTVGKNLLSYSEMLVSPFISATPYITKNVVTFPFTLGVNGRGVGIKFKVEPNTTYTLSSSVVIPNTVVGVAFYKNESDAMNHNNKLGIAFSTNKEESTKTFTTPNGCNWIVCGVYILYTYEQSGGTVVLDEMPKLQLEKNTLSTTYESHKSSILSLPDDLELRGIGDVKDTLDCMTGEKVERIGEIVLDGSEDERWTLHQIESYTTHTRFGFSLRDNSKPLGITHTELKCDRFAWINSDIETEHTKIDGGNARTIFIYIQNSRLTSQSIGGFKQWLQSNPITIQYQLETPVITKINLSSTLKSWNTTTHIYSEIPENSLYPILSHSNPSYPVILKPSTKYSIVANSYSNSHTNSAINFNLGGATASTTVGNRVTTITTPSTLTSEELVMSGRGNKLNNVMVIEGDVVGDEPYFEGICDCKSPILSNVGKNLFDINNHTEKQWSFSSGYPYEQNTSYGDRLKILGDEIHFSTDGGTVNKGVGYYIPLCKNTDYTFRINKKDGNGNYCVKLFLIYSSEYPLKSAIQQGTRFGINNETIAASLEAGFNSKDYDMCAIYIGGGWESGTQTTRNYVFNNISLTESSQQVEPYESNTTAFEQKDGKTIVLRSLRNGVCDTLNVETGEYVQRIGEKVLNGSESWYAYRNDYHGVGKSTFQAYCTNDLPKTTNNEPINCNRLVQGDLAYDGNVNVTKYQTNYVHNYTDGTYTVNRIFVSVNKEMFGSNAQDNYDDAMIKFKSWVQSNPITVHYQLATPIVSTVDVQGFPYAYTNGHVQLSSGSIEQSLTPTVEYSLSANKTGQINSNTKRVSVHQKQLDDFEAMMLTSMVQSAYDKAILQFDYEMQMMSLGGE